MDIKLQNAYVEVLLGNFMEVVKQNIMFQAQIEVSKSSGKDLETINRQIEDLTKKNLSLQSSMNDREKTIAQIISEKDKAIAQIVGEKDKIIGEKDRTLAQQAGELKAANSQKNDVSTLRQEKDRLQVAVNDLMRQLKQSKEELLVAKSESQNVLITNNNRIEDLTKYISRLEEAVPANKLKRVKIGDGNHSASSDIESDVKDGGSF